MPLPDAGHLTVGEHGPALERAHRASFDLGGVVREYVDAVIDHWVIPLPDSNPAKPALDLDFAPIDPVELGRHVSEPAGRAPSVESQPQAMLRADHAGRTITLEDFGTVGAGGDPYRSWLPARTGASAPFSKSNPGRTWRP